MILATHMITELRRSGLVNNDVFLFTHGNEHLKEHGLCEVPGAQENSLVDRGIESPIRLGSTRAKISY